MNLLSRSIPVIFAVSLCIGSCAGPPTERDIGLILLAPDYLEGILEKATDQFCEENQIPVKVVYEQPDNILARVASDSAIDIFLTAKTKKFTRRLCQSLMHRGVYSCPFRMSLVVAARAGDEDAAVKPFDGNLGRLRDECFRRVVINDPETTYEGRLAAEILKYRHLWKRLLPKLIMAGSTEHLLSYLKTGEADAAIVLESSLQNLSGYVILDRLNRETAENLTLCGAVTVSSQHKESAQAFVDLLGSRLCEIYKVKGICQHNGN
jgi:molybdate transport system substrate-binding protein